MAFDRALLKKGVTEISQLNHKMQISIILLPKIVHNGGKFGIEIFQSSPFLYDSRSVKKSLYILTRRTQIW